MGRIRHLGAGMLAALALVLVGACTPIVRNHGYIPTEEDLSLLTVGVDTRESVAASVGVPSAGGLVSDGGYYFVRSRWETRGPFAPKEVDRQVLAISFDQDGVVENIERFGLEDGRVVALSRRVTNSNIRNVSFLRQLFGNLGRLRLDENSL
ncbi:MAG: outer membrane protein assembly factor BamE [Rhodobacteraceae bacterium]|nr:outer membrane protein assembly factor BamE [Paracoccaceae bacterium]